jgi:hypothetical protein
MSSAEICRAWPGVALEARRRAVTLTDVVTLEANVERAVRR